MSRLRLAAVAAAGCAGALATLRARPPAGAALWERENYRGQRPSLVGGPAVVAGAALAAATVEPAAAVVAVCCGALGLYDDLGGDSHARGLRGHVRALRAGRLTTGLVKLAGLVTVGAAVAATEHRPVPEAAVDVVLLAGTANLVNLFDLRPGRALKVVVLVGAPLAVAGGRAGAAAAIAAVGSAAAALPADLGEAVMIGDCGANALGALLGWALSHGVPRTGRTLALVAVVGLTLASERHSFTAVIEGSPALSALDRWGRVT